jgi:hypothetical protein
MTDKQETSDFPMDLFDDSHVPSDDEEQIKLGEDGNSAATLPKNQNNQAAKQTVAKKGNKKDVPKFMHNGIKFYFRPADQRQRIEEPCLDLEGSRNLSRNWNAE